MQWLHRSVPLYQRGARFECSRNPHLAGHLPLRDQFVTLHAMTMAIPTLQRSHPLKSRMAPIRDELRPSAEELSDILTAARSQAERLKAEIA